MEDYPVVLTGMVHPAIRTALKQRGVRLDGDDVSNPSALLDAVTPSVADCLILHIIAADNYGRRKFFREVQKRRAMSVIVVGSKSDMTDDSVKKLIKDGLVTAIVCDGRKLLDAIFNALSALRTVSETTETVEHDVSDDVLESPEALDSNKPVEADEPLLDGLPPSMATKEAVTDEPPITKKPTAKDDEHESESVPEKPADHDTSVEREPAIQTQPEPTVAPVEQAPGSDKPVEADEPLPDGLPPSAVTEEAVKDEPPITEKPIKRARKKLAAKKPTAKTDEPEPGPELEKPADHDTPAESEPVMPIEALGEQAPEPNTVVPPPSTPPRKQRRIFGGKSESSPASPALFRPSRPVACLTVAVFQALSGGGCTWTAAAMASWLSEAGLRVALMGDADLLFLPPSPAADSPYTYAGVDVYCDGETIAEVMRGGYDYVVIDVGSIVRQSDGAVMPTQQRAKLDELTRAAVRVFVADVGRTRWAACESVLRLFAEMRIGVGVALSRAPGDKASVVRRLVKKQPVEDMPFMEDPFAVSPERDRYCTALFGGETA